MLAAAVVCAPAPLASAQTLNWDTDQATAGSQGGSGVWTLDPLNLNWNDGAANVAYTPASAVFAGTAGNVTLDDSFGALSAISLQFSSAGYALSGSPLTVSGGSITATTSASIASNLTVTASAGFIKSGIGTLTLSGANSLGNSVTVQQGRLKIDSTSGLITSGTTTISPGAQLLINSSIELSTPVVSSGLSISPTASLSFGPNVFETRSSLLIGGTMTMSPGSTFAYTSGSVIGTVRFDGGLLNIASNLGTPNSSGTYVFNGSGSINGTLPFNGSVRLEPTQAFTTLTVTATSFTTTNNLSLGSTLNNAPVVFDWGAAQTLTNNGTISINPGLTPTAPRALAGGYLINGKTLNVNGKATANHLSNTGTLNVAPTGSLTVRTYSGSGTLSGSVNLGLGGPTSLVLPTSGGGGTFCFRDTPSGTITNSGNFPSTLISTGTTLRLEPDVGTAGFTQTISSPVDISNSGTLILGSINADSDVSLTLGTLMPGGSTSFATLTNTGTISVNPGPGGGGLRTLPNIFNDTAGQININTDTQMVFGRNRGRMTIAAGAELYMLRGTSTVHGGPTLASFVNENPGTLVINGVLSTESFSNSAPFPANPGAGVFGTVHLRGSGFFSGLISSGMHALFQPGASATLESTSTLSNSGTFSVSPALSGILARVTVPLTNNGTLNFGGSTTASREFWSITNNPSGVVNIDAPLSNVTMTNSGTINVNWPTTLTTLTSSGTLAVNDALTLSTLTNSGAVSVASGKTLTAAAITHSAGSMIVNGAIDTSAFSFTGGSAGGTGAVRINDAGSLTFTGSPSGGNFQFIANGTMTGNVPSGATVMLKPTAGVAGAYSVTSGGIINNGTIVLSAQNADHDVTWNVVTFGAVATNNGTITIDPGPGGGGGRTITNILSNTATGVLNINTNATLGRLNNSGTVHVAPGKALSFSALSISLSNSAGIIDVAPGGALNVGGMQLSGGDILLAGDPANPASLLMSGMMTYTGAATPAQILTGPGALRGRMVLSGAAAFNIADGAAPIDTLITADITGGPLIKQGAGTLGVERLNGIPADISAGTVRVTSSNAAAYLSALTVASAAALDLRDNDLVVDSASFSTIRQLVIDGFGTTAGITSSTSDGSQILALFDNALVGQSQWQGQPISPSAIVGKYTYFGDMNIDGQVTGDDYTVIDAHLNTTPAVGLGWLNGDANVDGVVTGDDYTVVDANLGVGAGNPLTPSAIPEPAAGLMLLGSAAWLRMRRTHQTARKQRVFNGLLIH